MKSLILFILGVFVGFVLLSNVQVSNSTIKTIKEKNSDKDKYGSYDPGKDNQF